MFLAVIGYGGGGYWGKSETKAGALKEARAQGGMPKTPKNGWGVWRVSDDAYVNGMGDIHSRFKPIEVELHV